MGVGRDFLQDHRETLPARLATPLGRAAAADVRDAGAIAFRRAEDRTAFRWVPGGDVLRIEPGDDAPIVVELDARAWADFASETLTVAGLFYGGRMTIARGAHADVERWEPALPARVSRRRAAVRWQ